MEDSTKLLSQNINGMIIKKLKKKNSNEKSLEDANIVKSLHTPDKEAPELKKKRRTYNSSSKHKSRHTKDEDYLPMS